MTRQTQTMSQEFSRRLAASAERKAPVSREEALLASLSTPPPMTAIPKPRPVRLIDEIPEDTLIIWAWKIFTLCNLAWQYTDTVLQLCAAMRIRDTKPLVRRIHELRRRYDRFRARSIDSKHEKSESHNAEVFEEMFGDDFDKLFNGLRLSVARHHLTPDHQSLVIAVQQAVTVLDAVKAYGRICDAEIKKLGIWTCDCCLVQSEILELRTLMPQFAGDCYDACEPSRKATAQILANRMDSLVLTSARARKDCIPDISEIRIYRRS